MKEIKSLKDSRIQLAQQLSTRKGRIESGKFLIEGLEAIQWALEADISIDYILLHNKIELPDNIPPHIDVFHVSDGLLKKVTGTKHLVPVVAVGQNNKKKETTNFEIVLDNLQDYGNIGTIIRTCHAFGIRSITGTENNFDLFHRKTIDASRGKVFSTHYKKFDSPTETINFLKQNNYFIITTTPYGNRVQSLTDIPDKPVALVVGNETTGAAEEFIKNADITIQIPMHSNVESLNVGVATGISIYELKLKQAIGMIEKKIKSTLGREINVLGMLIQQALDKELTKVSEFTSKQIIFMMVLKCDLTMNIVDIQKQFGLTDNEINDFITPLIKKGYIKNDNQTTYSMTEMGIETLGKLWTIIENTENKITKGISEQDMKILQDLLKKLKANCIEIIDQHKG